jgi:purine-binding chemotaxis protein CheW
LVDLVKIRKKAKKKEEPKEEAQQPHASTPHQPPQPLDHSTARPLENSRTDKLTSFLATAGQHRDGLTTDTLEQTSADAIELLTFVIAGEHYAVAIDNIVEIVTPRPVTRIPNAAASIVGIISLRGTIVTLLDVRGKLRHPPAAAAAEDRRIIVVEHRGETVGFEVDKVLRVVKTTAGAIEPHPVVHASELDEAIRGVFRQGNALTILLDFDKLLDSRGHD